MQITRSEHYDRVSASSLSKLADEFGISGTVLAALCQKHQVPYPGSGYWTRKSFSIGAELPVLPEAPEEDRAGHALWAPTDNCLLSQEGC